MFSDINDPTFLLLQMIGQLRDSVDSLAIKIEKLRYQSNSHQSDIFPATPEDLGVLLGHSVVQLRDSIGILTNQVDHLNEQAAPMSCACYCDCGTPYA